MSPRRRFRPGEPGLLVVSAAQPRQWALALVAASCAVLMTAAIAVSALMMNSHRLFEDRGRRDHQALGYVSWFMVQFTSIDPYHANDYVKRVLDQAAGDFAKQYHDRENEILLQVARAEPATGTVVEAGVERWNDDGSVNVLVATQVTSKSPDEKKVFENANRWTVTARQEGNQWKISNLLQVI